MPNTVTKPSPKNLPEKSGDSQNNPEPAKSDLAELAIQFRNLVSQSGGDARLEEIWFAGLASYAKAGSKKGKLASAAKLSKKGRKVARKLTATGDPKPAKKAAPAAPKKSAPAAKKKVPAPRKSPVKRTGSPAKKAAPAKRSRP